MGLAKTRFNLFDLPINYAETTVRHIKQAKVEADYYFLTAIM